MPRRATPPPATGPRDWSPPGWDEPWPGAQIPRRRGVLVIAVATIVAGVVVALVVHGLSGDGRSPIKPVAESPSGTTPAVSGLSALASVGTCFDVRGTVRITATRVACTTAHDDELVRVETASGDDDHYPDDSYWDGPVARQCQQDLLGYTGQPEEHWPVALRSSSFVPRPDGWASGDRTIYCVAQLHPRGAGSVRHLVPVHRSAVPQPTRSVEPGSTPTGGPVTTTTTLRGTLVVVTSSASSDVCLALRPRSGGPEVVLQSATGDLSWLAATTSSGRQDDARSGIARGATPSAARIVAHAGAAVAVTGAYRAAPTPVCGSTVVFGFVAVS